jgi:hypothetical protein
MEVLNVITNIYQQRNPSINGRLVREKERGKQIIDVGFTLIEMWEWKWPKSKESKPVVKNIDDIVEHLNHRDAFHGHRTHASEMKFKNKMLQYIDVCSLYPTVQYFDY